MSAHDITRLMIQSALHKSLQDIAEGDHRAIRRLVDLGGALQRLRSTPAFS